MSQNTKAGSEADVDCPVAVRLPAPFCEKHLPKTITTMVLETENEEYYITKYLPQRSALSGGWRGFAMDKKLVEGNVVVFHLIAADKFKVHIIRTNDRTKVNPAEVNVLKPEVQEKCANKDRSFTFRRAASFEDFKIEMSEMLQNCVIPESTLRTYYELCCSQSAFLHNHFLRDGNFGVSQVTYVRTAKCFISKIVRIACALRNCTLDTSPDEFALWERTLSDYENLGMEVGFLRSRLQNLQNLAYNSQGAIDRQKYTEASCERPRAEREVKKLEEILSKTQYIANKLAAEVEDVEPKVDDETYKERCGQLEHAREEIKKLENLLAELEEFFIVYDTEIEILKSKTKIYELQFQETVDAPW